MEGLYISAATMENNIEVSQKIKNRLLYDPAIPFLAFYLKQTKTLTLKDTYNPMFVTALFTITKIWQTKCPWMDDWIKKLWCICIYTSLYTHTHTQTEIETNTELERQEYYSATKRMKSCHLKQHRWISRALC